MDPGPPPQQDRVASHRNRKHGRNKARHVLDYHVKINRDRLSRLRRTNPLHCARFPSIADESLDVLMALGTSRVLAYCVMPYAEGETLRDRMAPDGHCWCMVVCLFPAQVKHISEVSKRHLLAGCDDHEFVSIA